MPGLVRSLVAVSDRGNLSRENIHANAVQIAEFYVAFIHDDLEQAVHIAKKKVRAHHARNAYTRMNFKFRIRLGLLDHLRTHAPVGQLDLRLLRGPHCAASP